VLATLLLSGCSVLDLLNPPTADRDETGLIIQEGNVDVFSFEVGDCLKDLDFTNDGQKVFGGAGIPCSELHAYEVFEGLPNAIQSMADAQEVAEEICYDAFERFVDFPPYWTSLTYTPLLPTQESFNSGDRGLSCLAHRSDLALITESLRGKGADYWLEASGFLSLGQCWNGLGEGDDFSAELAETVDCDDPHVWEVYHVGFLPDDIEPPLDEAATEICAEAYGDFVGVAFERSTYYFSWWEPAEETFPLGDRRLACVIHTEDLAPIAGSLGGSSR